MRIGLRTANAVGEQTSAITMIFAANTELMNLSTATVSPNELKTLPILVEWLERENRPDFDSYDTKTEFMMASEKGLTQLGLWNPNKNAPWDLKAANEKVIETFRDIMLGKTHPDEKMSIDLTIYLLGIVTKVLEFHPDTALN